MVVSDDIEQTSASCPEFKDLTSSVRSIELFASDEAVNINRMFPVVGGYEFLDKFSRPSEKDDMTMVGVVDFANSKCPEFAQFMYGFILSQGIYCYALGVDAEQVKDMKAYVRDLCANDDEGNEEWASTVSSIDFSEPSSYLLCGVVAGRFSFAGIYLGDEPKPIDLFICAVLSCFDPLSDNLTIHEGRPEDQDEEGEGAPDLKAIILNLK